jgi:hypothetical protein
MFYFLPYRLNLAGMLASILTGRKVSSGHLVDYLVAATICVNCQALYWQ